MNAKKYTAEAIGTFWLTFAGCGSAVIAAGFPQVGIGLVGVSLAFGLSVVTMFRCLIIIFLLGFGIVTPAGAQIVALGASSTAGYGVGASAAYPAQLEAILRARGRPMSVTNAGVSGDTTGGMQDDKRRSLTKRA